MLTMTGDFFQDFRAAVNANDNILLIDIITDELAKMIVFDKGSLNEALKKNSKTLFDDKTSDNIYINELIARVRKEQPLRRDLSLIIEHNNSVTPINEKNFNANGRGEQFIPKNENNTIPEGRRVDTIEKALAMVVGSENEAKLKQKVVSHRIVKNMNFAADGTEGVVGAGKSKKNLIIKTGIITTVVLVSGWLLVQYTQAKYGWFGGIEPKQSNAQAAGAAQPVVAQQPTVK